MKITDITLTFLKIGKGLLRVQTDAGVEGWAEAPGRNPDAQGGEYGYYSGRVFEAYLESIIKPVLIGEDPLQIERHWETLALGKDEKLFKLPSDVVGVIDVALWDLMGKETGLPVYALMGGAARRDIELYWSTGSGWMLQPEEMLNLVEKGWDMNFRSFKIRMDWKGWRQDADPEKDYQMFKLVREFLAEGNYLGFDANNGTRSRPRSGRDDGLKSSESTISRSPFQTGIYLD
jgi:L-alanine-DL-glutamate epimerase-like enolase superfamily enzyme